MDWKVYVTIGVIVLGLAWLAWKNIPLIVKWGAKYFRSEGVKEGYAKANAEQNAKQAEALQRADEAREAASAVTELTDQEAIDLATTPPKRKK